MTDTQDVLGWELPASLDVNEGRFYRIKYGGNAVHVLDWYGHMSLLHQHGFDSIESELIDSGNDETRYAAVKVTITIGENVYSSIGGADFASDQVRDAEHVWSVAESRALKRAVKKALPMVKAAGPAPDRDQTGDIPVDEPSTGRTPPDPGIDPGEDTDEPEPEPSGPPDLDGGDDDQPW